MKSSSSLHSQHPLGVFLVFLRLGLTCFGGPVAHLGYFRQEFVERRRWLAEGDYADLVALCQFLPGPSSSQVGIAVGLQRAGLWGAFAAWAGFTLPSAVALTLFALLVKAASWPVAGGLLHGLKVVAVAVVAQALWQMGGNLCPDRPRATLAVASLTLVTLLPSGEGQLLATLAGGLAGFWLLPSPALRADDDPNTHLGGISRRAGGLLLLVYGVLLVVLPLLVAATPMHWLAEVACLYRAGALVFGGGHVVLPWLQSAAVGAGWIDNNTFLAGYGATQAMPGPLFTFAAFLGAAASQAPNGWLGALIAILVIFLPAFLLVLGAMPFWAVWRRYAGAQRALAGINAAVVGLLLTAFFHPVWTSAILRPADFMLAAADLLLLVYWRFPPWLVVAFSAGLGAALVG